MKGIAERPFNYDFFRAVRLIQSLHPDLPRIGYSLNPAEDPLRFGQKPSLAFAPSTIAGYQTAQGEHPARMWVNFLGLLGPNGPMPWHITEYARDRQINVGDNSLVRFLDIFHHRLLSFFFRAWASNQKTVDVDRPDHQMFGMYLGSFFGMGMPSLCDRDAVPDSAKVYFAGRLACHTRNAEGLAAIIQDFFGLPATVETFVGQWLRMPAENLCQLGDSPDTGCLGRTLIAGTRIWDCQLKFRLRLGPMKLADFQRLLPVNAAYRRLRDWVLNYVNHEFFWDAQLVLKAAEVPETRLGQAGMLGWTTWLKTQPFTRDADDLILQGSSLDIRGI